MAIAAEASSALESDEGFAFGRDSSISTSVPGNWEDGERAPAYSGHEMASRLSPFWEHHPDEDLFAAAAPAISIPRTIARESNMLEDPRTREGSSVL